MKNKSDGAFRQLCVRIFFCAIAMPVISAAMVYITYAVLLRGHFVNLMMTLMQNIFGMDYDTALNLYGRIFRSHMDAIFFLSLLAVFIGLSHIWPTT